MAPVCHFDVPAKDIEAIKTFYGGVFGWTFHKDEGSPDSWSIDFGSSTTPEPMTGEIVPRSAPSQPIGCHFRVSSIDESSARVKKLGGTVFVPKTAVAGKGYYACCLDPERNYFAIWESNTSAK